MKLRTFPAALLLVLILIGVAIAVQDGFRGEPRDKEWHPARIKTPSSIERMKTADLVFAQQRATARVTEAMEALQDAWTDLEKIDKELARRAPHELNSDNKTSASLGLKPK